MQITLIKIKLNINIQNKIWKFKIIIILLNKYQNNSNIFFISNWITNRQYQNEFLNSTNTVNK